MTKVGYDGIISRIKNRTIEPPENFTLDQLNAWLDGYAQCQTDILNMIVELSQSQIDM